MNEVWLLDKVRFNICKCGSDVFNITIKVVKRYTGSDKVCDRSFSFYEFTCVNCGKIERRPVEPMAESYPPNWEEF